MNFTPEDIRINREALLEKVRGKFPDCEIFLQHYGIDYLLSYAEDTPFFRGLKEEKLFGSKCSSCEYVFATPRAHCMECGEKTEWFELPLKGKIHTFTVCNYGGEGFLTECPYILILVEFKGVDTLFLSRLVGESEKELENNLLGMNSSETIKFLIGHEVEARFKKIENREPRITDVFFVLK